SRAVGIGRAAGRRARGLVMTWPSPVVGERRRLPATPRHLTRRRARPRGPRTPASRAAAIDASPPPVVPCWSPAQASEKTLRHLLGHEGIGGDLRVAAALAGSVARFLRHPLSVSDARSELARRLEHRDADFLALARDAIYAHPSSIHRRLLRHAGCELGDLERLVRQDGLEAALRRLIDSGVHLTVDEAKGRHPVVRGSLAIEPEPEMLTNPLAARHVPVASSGSRGARTALLMDLAFV